MKTNKILFGLIIFLFFISGCNLQTEEVDELIDDNILISVDKEIVWSEEIVGLKSCIDYTTLCYKNTTLYPEENKIYMIFNVTLSNVGKEKASVFPRGFYIYDKNGYKYANLIEGIKDDEAFFARFPFSQEIEQLKEVIIIII
ncbi:DUF4352 domain-containing protein [archaeon]|nr:DUF4352 domain-containing protein [archaeon]